MKEIDFSSKHDVMLRNYEGEMHHMDDPYFEVRKIAPGTWQLLSDGDFFYLIEGDDAAMCIDGGYGCGNLREFCQTLTKKPVKYIANSHEHHDHIANNCYFDCAFVSQEMKDAIIAGVKFGSFGDIQFPNDYEMKVIKAGDTIDLGGRVIEAYSFPDHSKGSLAYLDRRERIFFVGDEVSDWNKSLRNATVEQLEKQMAEMWSVESQYDMCCAGTMIFHKSYVRAYLENARYILSGHEGTDLPVLEPRAPFNEPERDSMGRIVYDRRVHRQPENKAAAARRAGTNDQQYKRYSEFSGCRIVYDSRKVFDEN